MQNSHTNIMTAKTLPAILGISVILIATVPSASDAYAQYMGNVGLNGETGANTLEENIQIARDRVLLAQENPATGSGTPYFAADGVVGAMGIAAGVFGGIAFAFFTKAKAGKYAAHGRG